MPVLEAANRPFEDVDHVGVVIQVPAPGYWHAGWLYRLPDEEPRILHLEWHYQLSDMPAAAPFRWAQLGLDTLNKEVLAVQIAKIANKKPGVPYAFDFEGVIFDKDSGDLLPAPAGKGLTCATLIVAVLATYGHQLLDIDTWPALDEDDEAFLQLVADKMEEHGAAQDHVDALRATNTSRIRPTHVVGCAHVDSNEWPMGFPTAAELAEQVVADLA